MTSKKKSKPHALRIDYKSICSLDHTCTGCPEDVACCCAKYEVCVSNTELKRINEYLPEAAKFCPQLKSKDGYDNVFDKTENGLYAIDTDEEDLCVFAYVTGGKIRCCLHAVEIKLGLPLGTVKPIMCILWPLTFSPKGDVLTVHSDAYSFDCNLRRKKPSRRISPDLLQTIEHIRRTTSK